MYSLRGLRSKRSWRGGLGGGFHLLPSGGGLFYTPLLKRRRHSSTAADRTESGRACFFTDAATPPALCPDGPDAGARAWVCPAGRRLCAAATVTTPRFSRSAAVQGKDYLINNDKFVLRFFPPQLSARLPAALRMAAEKPPDTCRAHLYPGGVCAALGIPARLMALGDICGSCCPSGFRVKG